MAKNLESITRASPQIAYASAIAGFGLSFGRSAGQKAKELYLLIISLIIITAIIISPYYGSRMLSNWYETVSGSLFKRLFGMVLLIFGVGSYALLAVASISDLSDMGGLFSEIDDSDEVWLSIIAVLSTTVLFCSLIFGIKAGRRAGAAKKRAIEVALHNEQKLKQFGLIELGDNRFEDNQGQQYRLEAILRDRVELFALGRRNKRAYIFTDNEGAFTGWTGLIKI